MLLSRISKWPYYFAPSEDSWYLLITCFYRLKDWMDGKRRNVFGSQNSSPDRSGRAGTHERDGRSGGMQLDRHRSNDYSVGETNFSIRRRKTRKSGSRENTGVVTNIKIANKNFSNERKNPSVERAERARASS